MYIVIALSIVFLCLVIHHGMKKPPNFPPGLPKLPILGSIPYIKPNLFEAIKRLHKKHGEIFSFYLGSDPYVIVADHTLFQEAMSSNVFLNRASFGAYDQLLLPDENGNRAGIICSSGKEWQEQRRFSLRYLKEQGFGGIKMEPVIVEEMQKCVALIAKECGKPTSLKLKLNISTLNGLWTLVTSEKMSYDDEKCKDIAYKFDQMINNTPQWPLMQFPWLFKIVPNWLGYSNTKMARESCYELIEDAYKEHLKTFDPNNIRDFMDAYIHKMKEDYQNPESSFYGKRGKENFLAVMTDMFQGGLDSIPKSINYLIWYMCKYPDLQRNIHEQIDKTIGRDKPPSLMNKKNTPYLEAVTYELTRITGTAFVGIFRVSDRPSKLGGYDLPKGTQLGFAGHEIMMNPRYFDDPKMFKPERFLDDEGNFRVHPQFCAFSTGKRSCLGRSLALIGIYIYMCGIMQRFQFRFAKGYEPDEIDHQVGYVLSCPDYPIVITERS